MTARGAHSFWDCKNHVNFKGFWRIGTSLKAGKTTQTNISLENSWIKAIIGEVLVILRMAIRIYRWIITIDTVKIVSVGNTSMACKVCAHCNNSRSLSLWRMLNLPVVTICAMFRPRTVALSWFYRGICRKFNIVESLPHANLHSVISILS